ncbi:hypothetical protein ACIBI9_22130 [Nonomuraea sp. NPDC050451]|uniref:hypothetical protein n=1 Tax=Nonomuraea sp. NPDC050451 TaxID=3364364 RepID=UPI0037B1B4B7
MIELVLPGLRVSLPLGLIAVSALVVVADGSPMVAAEDYGVEPDPYTEPWQGDQYTSYECGSWAQRGN